MLQNATPLRKSAPGPPNSSDEHVSCTAPATEFSSLQVLFKYSTPAIVFGNSLLTRCTIPCACHAKGRFNIQTWREHLVLCAFWLRHVLRATTACTFSTSPLLKVLWTWFVFLHFDFETCFALQQRALFRHLNFQECYEPVSFLHLTSKCASRHNGAQFFISHLASWLRTRRFSEPTFQPSGATNHWKNTVFRYFPTFSRAWIFFLLRLSIFWSSFFFSSLLWLFPSLLFICLCCRKFDF